MADPLSRARRARRRLGLWLALLTLAGPARAERLFVGVLEADSVQSVLYGASAFSRVADLPAALEAARGAMADALALPTLAAVQPAEVLRVVQTLDPALPRSDVNPANVAIVPLAEGGDALHARYAAAYASQREASPARCYERPGDTNLAPRVFVAISGRHALTSPSHEALLWAWDNRSRLIDAPAQSIPGTVRLLVNPQRFADLLGARASQAEPVLDLDRLARDFETLSFSLTLDGQAAALTLRGKPLAGSPLQALAGALRTPAARLWNGPPDNAFFVSLTACEQPDLWQPYLGPDRLRLLRPAAALVPAAAFTGERLLYLAPTRNAKGLSLVLVEPLVQTSQVAAAIQKLDGAALGDGLSLRRAAPRRAGGADVEAYDILILPPAAKAGEPQPEASVVLTLLSLFLKQAAFETAVKDGHLVTVLGPPKALDDELAALAFPDRLVTLQRRIGAQDGALSQQLYLGSSAQLAALLRHLASIVPGVRPEHLRVLPAGGDGATFGIGPTEGGLLTASLRFQTSEIAALQRINRDGREVLQELFFQMFSSQMLNLQQGAGGARETPAQP